MKSDKKIRELLNRFYTGETDIAEEKVLSGYFKGKNVAESFIIEQLQFESMRQLYAKEILTSGFDKRLFEKINNTSPQKKTISLKFALSGIAAGLLMLLSVWITADLFSPRQVYGTVTNPTLAFTETKNALQNVSENLNKALKPAKKATDELNKSLKKASEIKQLNQTLKKIQKLKEIEHARRLIQSINSVYINLELK